ncbi:MAG: type II secretion system F family protein [Anaerolineales bacterium]|nr:MAG: type II secretion system F family protein [Anaerolineales bacterium]
MDILLLSLVISTLAGLVVLIVVFIAFMGVQVRVGSPGAGKQISLADRIKPILGVVPLPEALFRGWLSKNGESRLMHSGMPWSARDFAALRWLLLLGSIAFGVLLGIWRGWDLFGWFLAIAWMVAGFYGPQMWLDWRVERRQMDIDNELPYFMDRLTLGMEAGLGFETALRRVAERYPGLLGDELRRMVRQLDRGHPRGQALEELSERNPSPDLGAFVAAVRQTDRLGTSLARILRVQTELLRSRRRRRAEEASRRLPILIVFPLVFFFLPALLIVYLAPPILHLFLGR